MITLDLKKQEDGTKRFYATGETKDFVCKNCGKYILAGFLCETDGSVFCETCQLGNDSEGKPLIKMSRCKHNLHHEHRHIKFYKS